MDPGPEGNTRKYPRTSAVYVVAVRRRGSDPAAMPLLGRTRSVGMGGVLFEVAVPFDPGDLLDLELMLGERTLRAAARVAYREAGREEPWGIGVQFLDLSDEDRDALLGCYLQQEYRIPS